MARVQILVPGQPEQVRELEEKPLVIGRGEDCDVQIAEVKASRRHLRLRRHEGGLWVAEDLGSSNGTWHGEQRLLRRALRDGDELRIGDTTVRFAEGIRPTQMSQSSESAPLLVGGSLKLESTTAEHSPRAPVASPAATEVQAAREPQAPRSAPARAAPRASLARCIGFVAVAVLAWTGVEFWLGAQATRQTAKADSNVAAREVLRHYHAAVGSPEGPEASQFLDSLEAYRSQFPYGAERLRLDGYAEHFDAARSHRRETQARFEELGRRLDSESASTLRLEYLVLARALPNDPAFAQRVRDAVAELDRRRRAQDLVLLSDLERRVNGAIEAGLPSLASRWVGSFARLRPGISGEPALAVKALQERADAAIRRLAEGMAAGGTEAGDPLERRTRLARLWAGLEGTRSGQEIEEEVRAMRRLDPDAPVPTEPGEPATPSATPPSHDLLARAVKAEEWMAARSWSVARAAFAELVAAVPEGMLRSEWQARVTEIDSILALVGALNERAGGDKKPRVKLSTGACVVASALPEGVVLDEKDGAVRTPWAQLASNDVLTLLTPSRLTPESRLLVATLAGHLGEREPFIATLLPLYEKSDPALLAQANRLVARVLFGRGEVPDGGYTAFKGELLDRAGLERAQQAERADALRVRANEILAAVDKLPSFQKLARLKEVRDDLDRKRAYALQAIFDTVHYPYPVDKGSQSYQAVQDEVDRRVAAVREIWEKDATKVRIERDGRLAKLLEEWAALLAELKTLRVDTAAIASGMERFERYATGDTWDVRNWFRDAEERDLMAYNRWVIDEYNPARTEGAAGSELNQIAITNAYRVMLGFMAVVEPNAAPFESINKENVVQILDAGHVLKLVPLRAVRVDNRLCEAARAHSVDMTARGYFAHEAPANPRTGEGPTAPHDRMRRSGYNGFGFSENIAGAGDPMTAHVRWCHSSGHHRNILSAWIDLGVGFAGNKWTQNFGGGGGGPPEIQPDTTIRGKDGRAEAGQAPTTGR